MGGRKKVRGLDMSMWTGKRKRKRKMRKRKRRRERSKNPSFRYVLY